MKINSRLLIYFLLFLFTGCTSESKDTPSENVEAEYNFYKIDEMNPDSLIGFWKKVRTVIKGAHLSEGVNTGKNYIMEFTMDSFYIFEYPKYLKNSSGYSIKTDSLIFPCLGDSVFYPAKPDCFQSNFFGSKGDTLVLVSKTDLGLIFYDHYIKTKVEPSKIQQLKTDIFDWSDLLKEWRFNEYFSYPEIDRSVEVDIDIPQIIDLRSSNKKNFHFTRDILVYTDENIGNTFSFRFQESQINADNSELLILTIESPVLYNFLGIRYDCTNE